MRTSDAPHPHHCANQHRCLTVVAARSLVWREDRGMTHSSTAKMKRVINQKRDMVAKRGLMSYPSDNEHDLIRQEGIALLMQAMVEPPIIKLPHVDVRVRLRPEVGAQMAYYLAIGDYEQNDLDLIAQYVQAGDRVMELGGGIGITGVMLAKVSQMPVTIVEPNPALHGLIKDTFLINAAEVELVDACAVGDAHAGGTVDFHLSPSYWWSSLVKGNEASTIVVRALRFSELLAQHRPSMLVIDVEGAEADILPSEFPYHVRRMLIEIHTPSIGAEATGWIASHLARQGFALKNIGAHSWFFERE